MNDFKGEISPSPNNLKNIFEKITGNYHTNNELQCITYIYNDLYLYGHLGSHQERPLDLIRIQGLGQTGKKRTRKNKYTTVVFSLQPHPSWIIDVDALMLQVEYFPHIWKIHITAILAYFGAAEGFIQNTCDRPIEMATCVPQGTQGNQIVERCRPRNTSYLHCQKSQVSCAHFTRVLAFCLEEGLQGSWQWRWRSGLFK